MEKIGDFMTNYCIVIGAILYFHTIKGENNIWVE